MKVKNNSRARQGLNTKKGRVFLLPGQSKEMEFDEVELAHVKSLKFLSFDGDDPASEPKQEALPLKGRAEGAASVTIPADWKEMDWPQRRSLASSLTDDPVKTSDDANRVIAAEIAERSK